MTLNKGLLPCVYPLAIERTERTLDFSQLIRKAEDTANNNAIPQETHLTQKEYFLFFMALAFILSTIPFFAKSAKSVEDSTRTEHCAHD